MSSEVKNNKRYINCTIEVKRYLKELVEFEKAQLATNMLPFPKKPLLTRLVEAEFDAYIKLNDKKLTTDEIESIKVTEGILSNKYRSKGIVNEDGERIIRYGDIKLTPMTLHSDARNLMVWLANDQEVPLTLIVENIVKAEYRRVFPHEIKEEIQSNIDKDSLNKGENNNIERLKSKEVEDLLMTVLDSLKALHPFQLSRFRPSIVRKLSIVLSDIQNVSHDLHVGVLERVAKREEGERIKMEKMKELIDKLYQDKVISEEALKSIED